MPREDSQFSKENNPARSGLPANTKPIAKTPIATRFYEADIEQLNNIEDRSGFIREAVHAALQQLKKG